MSLHRSIIWAAAGMLVAWLWLEAAALREHGILLFVRWQMNTRNVWEGVFVAYVVWLGWRYSLSHERKAAARVVGEIPYWHVVLGFATIAGTTLAWLWLTAPAEGATRWPTVKQLQCCEPWPKHDKKLRAWCEYWSKRLP